MKLIYASRIAILVFVLTGFCCHADAQCTQDGTTTQHVEYSGLTKSIVGLLRTRHPGNFVIGDYEIAIESLIDSDIAAVFDCDSAINQYITESGENASYGMLSDVIKNAIMGNFEQTDGSLFVIIESDTTTEGFYIHFAIESERPVSIPVSLNASDSSFSVSFDTTCIARFEAELELSFNPNKVNAGYPQEGIGIRINRFNFTVFSGSDSYHETDDCETTLISSADYLPFIGKAVPFMLENKKYRAIPGCMKIYAQTYWYLEPTDSIYQGSEYDESPLLTYKTLQEGAFKWEYSYLGSFYADMLVLPDSGPLDSLTLSDSSNMFHYSSDNLFEDSGMEDISFSGDIDLKEGITARNRRYLLK
jgi:hypothetical protein